MEYSEYYISFRILFTKVVASSAYPMAKLEYSEYYILFTKVVASSAYPMAKLEYSEYYILIYEGRSLFGVPHGGGVQLVLEKVEKSG